MTVTSVPAPVAPAPPAPNDGSSAADSGSADTGFASVLAGINDRAAAAGPKSAPARGPATKSPADRNEPADPDTPAGADPATDPVTIALLATLAGTPPRDPRADSVTANADPAAATAITADAAPPQANDVVGPTAAGPAAATATDSAAAALADAAASTSALPAPAPQAPSAATDRKATTGSTPAGSTPSDSTGAPVPGVPVPGVPARALPAVNAAPNGNPAGTDPATLAAAVASAGTPAAATPAVRTEPAPKSQTAPDTALINAAAASVDRAPTPEAAAAVKAAAAPAAPAPPPPAEQLAAVIRPLQRGADGTYQLNIEMRPADLGRVDMRVEMRDGVIHASIHTEHAQTAELVRNALDDLRSRLDADGVRAGQLTVDARGAQTSGRDTPAFAPERLDDGPVPAPEPSAVVAAPTTSSDSLLDVRI